MARRRKPFGSLWLQQSLNAMTPDLLGALAKAIAQRTADPSIRALVLTGEGRGFCSGQNLKAFEVLGSDIVAGVMKFSIGRRSGRCANAGCRSWSLSTAWRPAAASASPWPAT